MRFRVGDCNYFLNVEEYINIMKNHGYSTHVVGYDESHGGFLEAYVIVDTLDDLLGISDIMDYPIYVSRDNDNRYDGLILIDDQVDYD